VALKVVPKAPCDIENCFLKDGHECKVYTRENLPIRAKEQFDAAVRAIFRISSVLKGTVSRDFLLLIFFMNQFTPSPRVSH
jgi:hypothetical protein